MNKQRKHYEAAFKLEVARMVVDQGLSIAQVVKDMNIGCTAVCRWIEQYRAVCRQRPRQSGLRQQSPGLRQSSHRAGL